MPRYTYTIDEENAVSIFDTENPNENGKPSVFQPWNPLSPEKSWTKEEATAWAEKAIEEYNLPTIEYIPPFVKEHREYMASIGEEPVI